MHTTTAPIRTSSRLLALVLSTLLAASFVVAQQGAANADIAFPNTERIEGSDAISIGVAASQRIFQDDAANVAVLARSDNFPDALAATSVASTYGGPLLFTPTNRLDTAVRNELARVLEPGDTVFLMGGENALSPAVEDALVAEGYRTERINGTTRIETAARATDFVMAELNRQGRTQQTAVLVRSHGNNGDDLIRGWVDSVACGGLAANNDYPILLTNPGEATLHTSTRNRLDIYDFTKVLICGGPSAVPIEHQTEVSTLNSGTTSTVRASGRDRIETAVDVASRNGFWGHNDPTGEVFILVPGWDQNFAYGLAAAQLSDAFNAPLLLVSASEPRACEGTDRSRATLCYLERVGAGSVAGLVAVGSTTVISDATFSSAAEAAGLEEDVTPPGVPSGVSATNTPQDDGTNMDVAWNGVDDGEVAPKYNVYFKASDETALTKANGTKANGSTPQSATSLTISGLTAGTKYDAAVTSVDQFGNESALSAIVSATPTDEAPAAPAAAPTLKQVTDGVEISWIQAPEADAAGYRIQRGTEGALQGCDDTQFGGATYTNLKDADGAVVFVTDKTTTSYVDDTVEVGESYCYRYYVEDSTAKTSGTSPEAGPIEVQSTPPPANPPTVAPRLLAVNFDNKPGTVADPSGPSKLSAEDVAGSFRVDVVVPKGAFTNGEAGTVRVKQDDNARGQRTFSAPATAATQDFVISVVVSAWSGTTNSTSNVTAVFLNGTDEGPASAPWPVLFGGTGTTADQAPRPVLTVVGSTDTDPRVRPDSFPVVAGSASAPKVDPTPLMIVENIPTDADWFLQVWNNGVMRFQKCYTVTASRAGRVEINSADNPDEFRNVFEGLNSLTVSALDANTNCNDPFLNGPVAPTRSGDSNTVDYFLQSSATGIISTTPAFDDVDPFGETFKVEFNNQVSSATMELQRMAPVVGTKTQVASGSSTTSLSYTPATPLASDPGQYEMTVTYTPAASPTTRVAQVSFFVGITHAFHLSAAIGVDQGESITQEPTIVFNGNAPTGFIETAYGSASCAGLESAPPTDNDLTPEADRQAAASDQTPNFVRGQAVRKEARTNSTVQSNRVVCYRYTRQADLNATPPRQARVSVWQPDGQIPNSTTLNGDLAVRVRGQGPSFELALINGSWPTDDLWYGPAQASSAGNSNPIATVPPATGFAWERPPMLARSVETGNLSAIANDAVVIGWRPRYFLKNVYGNESLPGTSADGQFQGVSSIQPQNGLSSAPGTLSTSDSLIVDFPADIAGFGSGGSAVPSSSDGGLTILANASRVDPRFGQPGGATTALSGPRLIVTFGSAATVGGNPTPAAVVPPTHLHGGVALRGLPWLYFVGTGHSVLIQSDSNRVTNAAATF